MDQQTYRRLIAALWVVCAELDRLSLLHLEIAARRSGTRAELIAATALRRANDEIRHLPPDKRSL